MSGDGADVVERGFERDAFLRRPFLFRHGLVERANTASFGDAVERKSKPFDTAFSECVCFALFRIGACGGGGYRCDAALCCAGFTSAGTDTFAFDGADSRREHSQRSHGIGTFRVDY
jgi:hypothetical protein